MSDDKLMPRSFVALLLALMDGAIFPRTTARLPREIVTSTVNALGLTFIESLISYLSVCLPSFIPFCYQEKPDEVRITHPWAARGKCLENKVCQN